MRSIMLEHPEAKLRPGGRKPSLARAYSAHEPIVGSLMLDCAIATADKRIVRAMVETRTYD
jgi:hypothetical protein